MDVTDEEMAKALRKTLSEIESLKQMNEKEYKILKTGVLCKKLNLDENDLERIHNIRAVGHREYC